MQKNFTNEKYIWLITALLLLLGVFLLFGHYKAYLYEDEVLSYTAANSQEGMRPAVPLNRVTDGGEFVKSAITVSPLHRFDFLNAVKNTSQDPHPPLYLMLLHFVCSLFPSSFSKWYALSINLIFAVISLTALYAAAEKLYPYEDEKKALRFGVITVIIYLLSTGFVTQLMNLRMYVMLQAFTMLLTLQYLCLLGSQNPASEDKAHDIQGFNKINKKRILFLILNIYAGTMTHYYFLIFAFFEAAAFTLILLYRRNFRGAALHVLTYVLSAVLVILSFPAIIWQLTGSDVGSESFEGRSVSELIRRARVMMSHINNELYGGQLKLFLLFMCLWLIFTFVYVYKRDRVRFIGRIRGFFDIRYMFLLFTALGFFITVSITTPYLTSRYLFPVYPVMILLTAYAFLPVIRRLFRSETAGLVFFAIIMAVPLYLQISAGLYDVNKAAMQSASKEHSGTLCVFFRGISTEENYFELMNYKRLMSMRLSPADNEDKGDSGMIADEAELIVYVPNDKDSEEYFNRIREINPALTETERLYKAYYSDAYLMTEGKK